MDNTSNGASHIETQCSGWIVLPSKGELQKSFSGLETELRQAAEGRIAAGDYTADESYYVSHVDLQLCKSRLQVDDLRLEKIRRLCQLWDIDLRPQEITSHRKFIGPVIVAVKKRLYPILRIFFKDLIHQQRSFNAAAIALLADLANENVDSGGVTSEGTRKAGEQTSDQSV